MMPLRRCTLFLRACRVAVLPLALASCGHLRAHGSPGEPPESSARLAACAHLLATAAAALATPPDSIAGVSSAHHAHAAAMAQYHACLAGH
jgi:hypothetical protein